MPKALSRLAEISRNIDKLKNPAKLEIALKPVFKAALASAVDAYDQRLSSAGVGVRHDSIASGRLRRAITRRLSDAMRVEDGRLIFSVGIRSTPATKFRGDPSSYFDAVDSQETRKGGPSKDRVKQWLADRGIIASKSSKYASPGHFVVKTKKGTVARRISVDALVYLVRRAIWRKARSRGFKSLLLTKMLVRVLGFNNASSPLRVGLRTKLVHAITRTSSL